MSVGRDGMPAVTTPTLPADSLRDASAAVVRAVLAGGNHVVFGAPGSGRSRLGVELLAALAERGGTNDLLLLAPTRRAADRLRDAVAGRLRGTVGQVLVRTPASFAFSVLRARAALLGEPPPLLLTGADQDAALAHLLLGHAEGIGRPPGWPAEIPTEALGLATFRHELRDVLMRAAEAGWDGLDLQEVGRRFDRPAWVACGRVLQEYEETTRLGETTPDRGTRYDVAAIVDEAVTALRAWETDLPGHPRPQLRAVIHDDYQDATLAGARLLRTLAEDGAQVMLLGDPDTAVQTFRGAVPGLMERAAGGADGMLPGIAWPTRPGAAPRAGQVGEFAAQVHVLPTVWRGDARLRGVVQAVTSGLPALGDVARRRSPATLADSGSSVRVLTARSGPEEARLIARLLREHRLRDGLDWREMAVLARSSAQLPALRRGLRSGGVPVATAQGEVPLAAEPAVRPLLMALDLALAGFGEVVADGESEGGSERAVDEAAAVLTELLLSQIGGMDPVGLRALRRALRAAETAAGGTRSGDALLNAAVREPEGAIGEATLAPRLAGSLRRVSRVLAAGTAALRAGGDLQRVLWELWQATGLANVWRDRALGVGVAAERADADLDAVIALFRAAETFVERHEGARSADFTAYLRTQEFATDTLARTGERHAVEVLTAATAAGREWEVVVVAGVQEDVWPDLRLRARLLDPVGISDLAAGRGVGPVRPVDARRAVLADEQRTFASAVSRARRHLVVTAVQDGEQRPSHFLDVVDPRDGDEPRPLTPVPPALDLRGLVGALRREVLSGTGRADQAAGLLADLATSGAPGADPSQWWGHPTSSDTPLWSEDDLVPVRPSALPTLTDCALRWALAQAGGENGGKRESADLGTLIHAIAAEFPRANTGEGSAELAERMLTRLDELWPRLRLAAGWGSTVTRRRAERSVRALADYVVGIPGEVEVEAPFDVTIGRAVIHGQVDRLERLDAGQVRVVDLKTSRNPVSKVAAETHAQLAGYQAAVSAGAFEAAEVGGARLVYLGNGRPELREQPAASDWPLQVVHDAVDTMAAATFTARPGSHCATCPVTSSCPVRSEGGRVIGR